jgi:hypothetical protein
MTNLTTKLNDVVRQSPLVTMLVVFVAGAALGWFVLGWLVWPVEFVNGNPSQLDPRYQQDYVRMAASAYALERTAEGLQITQRRIQELGPNAATVVSDTIGASTGNDALRVQELQFVLSASGGLGPAETTTAPSLFQRLQVPLLAACGVVLVGVLGVFLYLRFMGGAPRTRAAPRPSMATRLSADLARTEAGAPGPAGAGGAAPLVRFMTTYTLGDDVYDDSFSIDGPDGSFLGECGMGISETVGVGDPKKVTAFEVWLFDKNDIRTVTKVLMSEHAFRDEALKSRLAAKGEPVQAAGGDIVSLETATLIVTARVVDMAYGGGALPPHSFFERLTIELAAFKKPETVPA